GSGHRDLHTSPEREDIQDRLRALDGRLAKVDLAAAQDAGGFAPLKVLRLGAMLHSPEDREGADTRRVVRTAAVPPACRAAAEQVGTGRAAQPIPQRAPDQEDPDADDDQGPELSQAVGPEAQILQEQPGSQTAQDDAAHA